MKTVITKQPNQQFPWEIARRDHNNKKHRIGAYLTWQKAMEIAHTIHKYQEGK